MTVLSPADSKIHNLQRMASRIQASQALIMTTPRSVVTKWVLMGVAMLLLILITSYLLGAGVHTNGGHGGHWGTGDVQSGEVDRRYGL